VIICGNSLLELKSLEANSVDSVVTDPPYGLKFMSKAWDYDVPTKELWSEVLRVLKPGGYLLAFAGTRTQHRMAVNIEDAGFEIRDMIAWIYGSGFPKSHNIGKAVDKIQGNKREYLGKNPDARPNSEHTNKILSGAVSHPDITKGSSPYEGWGTALKPAVEPVGVYTKPLQAKHIIAILIDELWKLLPANDATTTLRGECTHLDQLLGSVQENARMSVLENIESVKLAEQANTSVSQHLNEKDNSKDVSAQEPVRVSGNNDKQVMPTLTGEAEGVTLTAISISVLTEGISENTVLLWRNISEKVLQEMNTSTTLTASKLITELKTLRLLLLQNTLGNTGSSTSTLPTVRPALEPITVARKPFKGNVAQNVLEWGTGGINIDGSRVGSEERFSQPATAGKDTFNCSPGSGKEYKGKEVTGRFPANLIHDGSDEVVGLFPDTKSGGGDRNSKGKTDLFTGFGDTGVARPFEANSGSAARFFYCAKAGKAERNKGLEGFEQVHPGQVTGRKVGSAGAKNGGYAGMTETPRANIHPTVKPVKLMQYLVKLVTPVGGTCLDPFSGSGTTGIACKLEGFDYIGIELDEEYVKLSEARIEAWESDKQATLL